MGSLLRRRGWGREPAPKGLWEAANLPYVQNQRDCGLHRQGRETQSNWKQAGSNFRRPIAVALHAVGCKPLTHVDFSGAECAIPPPTYRCLDNSSTPLIWWFIRRINVRYG